MDIVTKFIITCSVVFAVAIVVAILCHKAEKKIDAMDNLKDVDNGR
ncbi:MAG: hypothetical protein J6T22_09405 [Bacteroidales bacterium]|nr:hypothetical protein [Bacteroidales bacterium]MBO7617410.1 hypothetical protein [Bacteroidales bacterium]